MILTGNPDKLGRGSCPHTQQVDWFICWAYKWPHCRKLLYFFIRYLVGICMRTSSLSVSITLVAWSLDVNVAAALGTCPGCAHHTVDWGEATLSGVRRWAEGGMSQARTPTFPFFQWCMFHPRYSAFQQVQLLARQQDPRCSKELTYPNRTFHCKSQ